MIHNMLCFIYMCVFIHRPAFPGEAVLLYPGGVREAFKRRGEAYGLFWPER